MSELDDRLEANLRALVPVADGDWEEVVARARRVEAIRSRRRRRLVVAAASVALVLAAASALAVGDRLFGWFTVSTSPQTAPTLPRAAPYIAGQMLHLRGRRPQRLAAPLLGPLLGMDRALAVAAPDRRHVAYHSWRDRSPGVPLLFVHDTVSRTDRVLARGAQTLAWSRGDLIAYFKADRPGYDGRRGAYVGRVLVQRSLSGTPVPWTRRSGGYEVLAWARKHLLVGVRPCFFPNCHDDPRPGVYVLSPSGRLRPIPLASLGALSPDGRYAFGRYDPVPGQDSPSPLVRVVEIATGRVLATLDLTRRARGAGMRGLLPGALQTASWRGDEIVGAFAGRDGALFFLRVRGRSLRVVQVVRVRSTTLPGRGIFFRAPIFTDGTRRVVVPVGASITDERAFNAVLACDRSEGRCVRGRVLPSQKGNWFAIVTNPSRPSAGR